MAITLDGRPVPHLPQSQAEFDRLLRNPADLAWRVSELQKLVGNDFTLPKSPEEIVAFLNSPEQILAFQTKLGNRLVVPPAAVEPILSPPQRQLFGQWNDTTSYLRIGGIGTLAFAVGLAVLAVFTLLAGAIIIGCALIAVTLPLLYIGYNCFMVSRNMNAMSQNMLTLAAAGRSPETIKPILCKNTILFECLVEKAMNQIKV